MPAPLIILGAAAIRTIAMEAVKRAAAARTAAAAAKILKNAENKINKGSGSPAGKNPGRDAIAKAQEKPSAERPNNNPFKKTDAEKETIKKGKETSRAATERGEATRIKLDLEDSSRTSNFNPARDTGSAPKSNIREVPGLKPTDPSKYGKGGRTEAQRKADINDFIKQRLKNKTDDYPPSMGLFGGPVRYTEKGTVANPAAKNTVASTYKPTKPASDASAKTKAQYVKDLKAWQDRQKPSTPTPKQALREDASKQLGELRSRAPRKPNENASAATWDKYRANLKKYEADQKRIAEDPGKGLKQIQKEADLARASNALGSPANKTGTPKPTPATPKATPKAPKDPAKTAAAQKKQPAKKTAAAASKKSKAPTDPAKKAAAQKKQPAKKTAAAASKKSAAPKDPAKKTQLQKKQTPLAKVPIKELTLGKPGKVSKKTLGMYGVAGVGALGYAVGGMNKSKGTDDKRITNESGRIISRTKLRTDKYGRRVTAEETKKRDNFRDSRKRMSADRNEEARETEMDRRKKFRKTKGKEAFGKAATRITKDKSKLAGKGIRTKRSEEEKRQRITYI